MASDTWPPKSTRGQQVTAQLVGAEQVAVGQRRQPARSRGRWRPVTGSGRIRASATGSDHDERRRCCRPRSSTRLSRPRRVAPARAISRAVTAEGRGCSGASMT